MSLVKIKGGTVACLRLCRRSEVFKAETSKKLEKGLIGAICSMQHIEEALERLKDWARKLIELLLGPEMEPEPEPIPIPVEEHGSRRYR